MTTTNIGIINRKAFKSVAILIAGTLLLTTAWVTSTLHTADAAQLNAIPAVAIKFYNGKNQEIGSWRPFPLDRVARGEKFRVTVTSTIYPITIKAVADNRRLNVTRVAHEAFEFKDIVPTDPYFDNVTVTVSYKNGKVAERRLPIGRK